MMELTFYSKKENEPETIKVSEKCYERLAKVGFSKKVEYKDIKLLIEDEEYEIIATNLNRENLNILIILIENERHKELIQTFKNLDENLTIKEIRENCHYVRELTTIYDYLISDNYQYFSYE